MDLPSVELILKMLASVASFSAVFLPLFIPVSRHSKAIEKAANLVEAYQQRQQCFKELLDFKSMSDAQFYDEEILSRQVISESAKQLSKTCSPITTRSSRTMSLAVSLFFFTSGFFVLFSISGALTLYELSETTPPIPETTWVLVGFCFLVVLALFCNAARFFRFILTSKSSRFFLDKENNFKAATWDPLNKLTEGTSGWILLSFALGFLFSLVYITQSMKLLSLGAEMKLIVIIQNSLNGIAVFGLVLIVYLIVYAGFTKWRTRKLKSFKINLENLDFDSIQVSLHWQQAMSQEPCFYAIRVQANVDEFDLLSERIREEGIRDSHSISFKHGTWNYWIVGEDSKIIRREPFPRHVRVRRTTRQA